MTERLEFTRRRQYAVFITALGFTGGMGRPILDSATGEVKRFDGLPVYVDFGKFEDRFMEALPTSWEGRIRIMVAGNVRLAWRVGWNHSIPGLHFRRYWRLRVHGLDEVRVLKDESANPRRA